MGRTLLAAALAAAFLGSASAQAGEAITIEVGHNRVEPDSVTVAAGATVTFHNRDAMPGGHTLVAADGSFESPPLGKGESWSHRFAEPGQVEFQIKQHPDAKGTIVVE